MMHRLLTLFRFGRVKLVDDSDVVQRMQVFEGDLGAFGGARVADRVAHFPGFGLLSVPPLDSEVLLVALAGDRSQTVALVTNHQSSRPTGFEPGDSGLYDVRGALVTLSPKGITIDAAGNQVTVRNASKLRCECDIEATGDIVSRADGQQVSLNALHDAYNGHAHTGVSAGSAKTGPTDKIA